MFACFLSFIWHCVFWSSLLTNTYRVSYIYTWAICRPQTEPKQMRVCNEAKYILKSCPGSQTTVMVQREFTTLGISANTDTSVRQRGEPGQALVPILTLKQTNKQTNILNEEIYSRNLSGGKRRPYLVANDPCRTFSWPPLPIE